MEDARYFPFPKKKGKNNSEVWSFFEVKLKEACESSSNPKNLYLDYVYCKFCRKRYRYHHATTTMKWHLDNEHRHLTNKNDTCTSPGQQKKITSFVSSPSQLPAKKMSQEKASCVDQKLLNLIIDKMLPLSTVEHPSFVDFASALEPTYKVPGRKLVMKKLNEKYDRGKKTLGKLVADCPSVALTHDSWTSIRTESFDTVTAHFIDDKWELHSSVLRTAHFTGAHTGANIASHLEETIRWWKITDPTFVTDNAANERKAIRDLGYQRVGCYGHRINLVVKKGLQIPEAKKIIEKGRSIVSFFNTSTTATEMFELAQAPEKALHLIQDVCTRWNSSLDMLIRIEKLFPALTKVVVEGALGKRSKELEAKMFTYSERNCLRSLVDVLQPFKKATEMLSSDLMPTHGLIIPALKKLFQVLTVKESDSQMVREVKETMKSQLEMRTDDTDIALIACKLTPSVRHLAFATEEERSKAVDLLHAELLKCYQVPKVVKTEKDETETVQTDPPLPSMGTEDELTILPTEEQPPVKKIKIEKDATASEQTSWLNDIIFVSESKAPDTSELAQKELNSYLTEIESPVDPSCTALSWWRENCKKYPKLSVLAKKFLAIPASSVSSERVFSLTGNLVSKQRSRLKSDLVDVLVFLNKNKKYTD